MYQPGGPDSDEFMPVSTLISDPKMRSLISEDGSIERFNAMQSILANQLLNTNDSMVISAPTGSGKTLLHELSILRLIKQALTIDSKIKPKVLFIAPTKALCAQRVKDWKKFKQYDLTVVEMTGDVDWKSDCIKEISQADLIVTTPEKWDSLTRRWKENIYLLGTVNLMLLDEVHMVGEDRGPRLESVVIRTKLLTQDYRNKINEQSQRQLQMEAGQKSSSIPVVEPLRIIALSATLPNLQDIGEWLGCAEEGIHYFDQTYRPVPLVVKAMGCGKIGQNEWFFDKKLDDKVPEAIEKYSQGGQTIIFCHSQNASEKLAISLSERMGPRSQQPNKIHPEAHAWCRKIEDRVLRDLLYKGYAYHNARLTPSDRECVEKCFIFGFIHILSSTSTLAHGMNLPAHCVIVKGTRAWRSDSRGHKGYCDIPRSDVIQMIGRAGRPGFDKNGIAVILTDSESEGSFTTANTDNPLQADYVESRLQDILIEAICTEITQIVITNVRGVMIWLKHSLFFIRVQKNPEHYGYNQFLTAGELDNQLERTCISILENLSNAGLIEFNHGTQNLVARPEGHIMSRNMIKFDSMIILLRLHPTCNVKTLIVELGKCVELHRPVRRDEKKVLNEHGKNNCRFPLKSKDRVKEPEHKAFVLLQIYIARIWSSSFQLRLEMEEIYQNGRRLLNAIADLAKERQHGILLESAILLARSLNNRIWYNNDSVFLQTFPALSDSLLNKLKDRSKSVSKLGLSDTVSKSLFQIATSFECSQCDATKIMTFTKIGQICAAKLSLSLTPFKTNVGGIGHSISIEIKPLFPELKMETDDHSVLRDYVFPNYKVVCSHLPSGKLICHRELKPMVNKVRFSVPLPQDMALGDIKCSLISDCVGLDSIVSPTNNETIGMPARISNTKTKSKVNSKVKNAIPTKVTPCKDVQGSIDKYLAPEILSPGQLSSTFKNQIQNDKKGHKHNEASRESNPKLDKILKPSTKQSDMYSKKSVGSNLNGPRDIAGIRMKAIEFDNEIPLVPIQQNKLNTFNRSANNNESSTVSADAQKYGVKWVNDTFSIPKFVVENHHNLNQKAPESNNKDLQQSFHIPAEFVNTEEYQHPAFSAIRTGASSGIENSKGDRIDTFIPNELSIMRVKREEIGMERIGSVKRLRVGNMAKETASNQNSAIAFPARPQQFNNYSSIQDEKFSMTSKQKNYQYNSLYDGPRSTKQSYSSTEHTNKMHRVSNEDTSSAPFYVENVSTIPLSSFPDRNWMSEANENQQFAYKTQHQEQASRDVAFENQFL